MCTELEARLMKKLKHSCKLLDYPLKSVHIFFYQIEKLWLQLICGKNETHKIIVFQNKSFCKILKFLSTNGLLMTSSYIQQRMIQTFRKLGVFIAHFRVFSNRSSTFFVKKTFKTALKMVYQLSIIRNDNFCLIQVSFYIQWEKELAGSFDS